MRKLLFALLVGVFLCGSGCAGSGIFGNLFGSEASMDILFDNLIARVEKMSTQSVDARIRVGRQVVKLSRIDFAFYEIFLDLKHKDLRESERRAINALKEICAKEDSAITEIEAIQAAGYYLLVAKVLWVSGFKEVLKELAEIVELL